MPSSVSEAWFLVYPVAPLAPALITRNAYRRYGYSLGVACPYCGGSRVVLDERVMRRHGWPVVSMRPFPFECADCRTRFLTFLSGELITVSDMGVYFIECCDFIKIGISVDTTYRFRTLLAQNPHEITPIGFIPSQAAYMIERELHQRFEHLHHRDEWFHATSELREWIAAHAHKPDKYFQAKPSWNFTLKGR